MFLHYFQRSYVVYPPEGPRPPSGDEIRDLIKKNKATPSWIFRDGCGARIIKQDEVGSKSMVWSWQAEDQSETRCKWPFVYPLRATFGWRVLIQRLPQLVRRSWQRIEASAAGKCVELFMTSVNFIAECNITGISCTILLQLRIGRRYCSIQPSLHVPNCLDCFYLAKFSRQESAPEVPQKGSLVLLLTLNLLRGPFWAYEWCMKANSFKGKVLERLQRVLLWPSWNFLVNGDDHIPIWKDGLWYKDN